MKGYNLRIARVDLTSEKVSYQTIEEEVGRRFIGGVGLAAKILWDETAARTDPFSSESLLLFMTGPLTGTRMPKSSRYIVAGISPLTGIWGQAHGGGSFADELRHSGIDGIVVSGEATKPVYLWVHDQNVEIRKAEHLWGKDTYEAAEDLRKETDAKASPACIGPAGEKLVKYASVMSDGKEARAAARCGLGALMGSKRLKAVVARGTHPLYFHDEERFNKAARSILTRSPIGNREENKEFIIRFFTNFFTLGRVPVRNFSRGTFEAGKKCVEDMRNAKPFRCKHCPYDCTESHMTKGGERHMVWEAWGPLGTNCLIDNPEALQEAYSLCNRYGMDAISIGAVMSFAFECFEKGLLTTKDTGGIELRWGNHQAMLEMVRRIGDREGLGALLGEGVKRAAEEIGGMAHEYAMHVKGMELPAHEPRSGTGTALAYATGSIGAAHMEPLGYHSLENAMEVANPVTWPELGFPSSITRFENKGKGPIIAKTQDFGCLVDSLTVCLFLSLVQGVQPSHYAELLRYTTGWDVNKDELLLAGERIFNLKRMFNVRRGISRKDDTLPPRVLTHPLDGGTQGNLPFLGLMLNEYYAARGWSEEGIPTRECLTRLALKECVEINPLLGFPGK